MDRTCSTTECDGPIIHHIIHHFILDSLHCLTSGAAHPLQCRYQHAVGMTTVNPGGSGGVNISTNIPLVLSPIATGVALNSSYISEFGSVGMSSWESMSATLKPEHWGIHGGMSPDTCGAGLPNAGHRCVGGNPMAQRNYPCDSLIVAYFGTPSADLDAVGEGAFKKQLWLCMAGMALKVKAEVEHYRSQNIFGLLVWQLNEIWPTGGWGSVEYGGDKPGQVSATTMSAHLPLFARQLALAHLRW